MEHSLMNTYSPLSPVLEKGEGVYLYDTNGKKYLDLTSGIGVNSLGYNNSKWTSAIEKQIHNLQTRTDRANPVPGLHQTRLPDIA